MDWHEHVFISDQIEDVDQVCRDIETGRARPDIHLLTLSHNRHNLCEIVPAVVLVQKSAREHCPVIVGIAGSRKDAFSMVRQILLEVYQRTGGFDLKTYMESR